MKILVTGGAGFIGSHLVDYLVANGHSVRVLDNLEFQVHRGKIPDYLNKEAEYLFGDIRDYECVKRAVDNIEVIFHQAALVGVGQSMYLPYRYVEINTLGTANLLQCILNEKSKIQKLVVASSMSNYGEGGYVCEHCGSVSSSLRGVEQLKRRVWEMQCPTCNRELKPVPTSERKTLQPTSIYAITKKDQEEMCILFGKTYNIPAVALRYFNVYGPRQSLSNPYTGLCAIVSSRIKNGNPPIIYEDGCQTRDFVSVHDIVRANVIVMESEKADGKVFNVGTGSATRVLDVVGVLLSLYGSGLVPEVVGQFRAGDIRHCYADISQLSAIGYKPHVDLKEGMSELVKWTETAESMDMVKSANEELEKMGLKI